jgi:ribosomal protein L16 Arg81 hydroxylase
VDLEPGDVLYVPHEWWHFVECLDLSISINTWVEMETDAKSRLTEIIAKTLLQSLMESNFITYELWLNESEVSHWFMFAVNMTCYGL